MLLLVIVRIKCIFYNLIVSMITLMKRVSGCHLGLGTEDYAGIHMWNIQVLYCLWLIIGILL